MTMQEFYETYNLNKYDFATIVGVGTRTLVKYAKGVSIRDDAKARIETAIRVAEKHNLVRPKFDYAKSFGFFGPSYKHDFHRKVHEYEKLFRSLIDEEP